MPPRPRPPSPRPPARPPRTPPAGHVWVRETEMDHATRKAIKNALGHRRRDLGAGIRSPSHLAGLAGGGGPVKRPVRRIPTALAALAAAAALFAAPTACRAPAGAARSRRSSEELDKARAEVQLYQKQLEEVRVKRWQDKRNAVAAQEAFSEAWNEIRADIDRLVPDEGPEGGDPPPPAEPGSREAQRDRGAGIPAQPIRAGGARPDGGDGRRMGEGLSPPRVEKLARLKPCAGSMGKGTPPPRRRCGPCSSWPTRISWKARRGKSCRDKLAVKGVAAAKGPPPRPRGSIPAPGPRWWPATGSAWARPTRPSSPPKARTSPSWARPAASTGSPGNGSRRCPNPCACRCGRRCLAWNPGPWRRRSCPWTCSSPRPPARASPARPPTAPGNDFKREFEGGGWVMWPIFAIALAGFLITLEKCIVFLRPRPVRAQAGRQGGCPGRRSGGWTRRSAPAGKAPARWAACCWPRWKAPTDPGKTPRTAPTR